MKKIILATVAFSFIATPAAFAQSYHPQPQHKNFNSGSKVVVKVKPQVRKPRWARGQRLDNNYRRNYINARDYRRYRLSQPPRGYQWVRVDNDFVMVSVATGVISSIIGAALSH
jgi:Ni/Co efflux regulator RcnB